MAGSVEGPRWSLFFGAVRRLGRFLIFGRGVSAFPKIPHKVPNFFLRFFTFHGARSSATCSHNHRSCRPLELPGISHQQPDPALLDSVAPTA